MKKDYIITLLKEIGYNENFNQKEKTEWYLKNKNEFFNIIEKIYDECLKERMCKK